ncbi:MAG: GNAT family N-acetyltransferase [Nitrospirae bacterium]|nr:GNAT family N-acetyltransferase [Nitrospirota bacterium]
MEANQDMSESRVVVIDPLRDARWDSFVESHAFGWICHLSSWKRILEESFPHMKGHYLALINERENTIKAALPVFEVRSWLTGNRLVSIPFATLCDPLISTSNEMEILLGAAVNLANELGTERIEVRALASSDLIQDSRLYRDSFYKHHFLLLDTNLEELKKSFHRTCVRQRIERALKSSLSLREAENETDLKNFFCLYMMTRKRLGLPPQPYTFIKILWEILLPSKKLSLLLAEHNGKAVAGIILFKFKDRVSVEFSAFDESYLNISPTHYLFWEAIKLAYHQGYKIFDFGRTAITNKPLMDFKGRWSTKVVDLPQFYYPNTGNGRRNNESSFSYNVIQILCRRSPDFALPYIGNFCYRHLG